MIELVKHAHFYPLEGLTRDNTYAYYDYPVVYSAHNKEGDRFISMLLKDEEKRGEEWMLIPVSQDVLDDFEANKLDLLEVINKVDGVVLIIEENREGFTCKLRERKVKDLEPELLPDAGFYAREI